MIASDETSGSILGYAIGLWLPSMPNLYKRVDGCVFVATCAVAPKTQAEWSAALKLMTDKPEGHA